MRNSQVLKGLVAQTSLIAEMKAFDVVIVGPSIYEYEMAQVLQVPWI